RMQLYLRHQSDSARARLRPAPATRRAAYGRCLVRRPDRISRGVQLSLATSHGLSADSGMFFFMLLYLIFVLVRPQDYPQWENVGVPILPILLVTAFLFWLPSRRKDLGAPQHLLLFAFLLVLMLSQIVNGWMGGAMAQLASFGPALITFLVLSHAATERRRVSTTMALIVLCCGLLAIHGIEQVQTGVGWTGAELSQGTRIQYVGIFNDPNDLGLLFVIALPMALFLASRGGLLGLRRLF